MKNSTVKPIFTRRPSFKFHFRKPDIKVPESVSEPTESYVACESKKGHAPLEVSQDGLLKQALQGIGTIFSGITGYMGLHNPAAKRAAKSPCKKEELSPAVLTVLEQPCSGAERAEGMTFAEMAKACASSGEVCSKEKAAYKALNGELQGRFPTLETVFADPDAFKADITGRFEAQKVVTPEDPYQFDFSDYGVPVLMQIGGAVDKEIKEVKAGLEELDGKRFSKKKRAEREVGLQYLGDLKDEIAERVESGDVSYRRMQELGYFTSCALGYFDMDKLHLRDRMLLPIDSYLQAEDRVDIVEEYRRYKDNDFTVHQKPAHRISGFQHVEESFEKSYFNPERMEMINLPSMEDVDQEPFMRLLNKDIYLAGVAADPLAADGFVRQGRLFWLHDVRHNAAIFAKKKDYEEERALSPEQKQKLDRRIDVWNIELKEAMHGIEDRQMMKAVDTLVFNLHHDRGLPFVPSTYDENEFKLVTKSLRFMWGVSGQEPHFDKPGKKLKEGYKWLDGFWKERRDQERAIVGA